MKLRCLLVASFVATCLAAGTPVAAQTAGQPVFKSGVDLVRIDASAVDGAGRPITDLRVEEIEILENGRTLPVVLFQRVTEPAAAYVDAALRAVTAEVSSNEAFPRGHLYILIFDQQHITPGNEQRARTAAETFIRTRVRPSDRVALFALPGPGPQLGFTADKTRAVQALESIRGMSQRVVETPFGTFGLYEAHRIAAGDELLMTKTLQRLSLEGAADLMGLATRGAVGRGAGAAAEDPALIKRLLVENARMVVNQSDAESRQLLQRLADVIEQFREIEGRKTIVLFSEGFFQDNLPRELEEVAAAAAQSYAVFYTFDLNRRTDQLSDDGPSSTTLSSEIQARIAPLSTLAVETNGMMVIDAGARSGAALSAIANQAQDYYLVGFTPSEKARTNRGRYQRITIRTTRPGARISARTGYAMRDPAKPVDRRKAIDTVLRTPFVQQSLKVDYTTYVMKAPGADGQRVVLSLDAALPVRTRPGETADVVFVARDVRDGRVVASGSDTIPLPASASARSALGSGSWRVQFNVPAGSYVMRAVVREPGGLTGSADRRLDVKPLAGPDVAVSDLVLGSALGGLPVKPRAYAGDGLSGVVESYGRTAVQLEGLDVSIELRDASGAQVTRISADLQAPIEDETGLRRRALFLLPLASVAPGNYQVHAAVRARGEIIAERLRQVEVLAGAAPAAAAQASAPIAISPLDIVKAELGHRYVASIARSAAGTQAATAAARAAEGRWEEAELQLQRNPAPAAFATHALHGLALFVREEYGQAAAALSKAMAADPSNALTAFYLGWAHEGVGDSRAALSAWRSAAHLDPSLVSAHLALADGYLRLSNPALAVQALRAGLAALPSSPELQARLSQIERRH